jgi:hypothetical protein
MNQDEQHISELTDEDIATFLAAKLDELSQDPDIKS